jgi:hypothetical protein
MQATDLRRLTTVLGPARDKIPHYFRRLQL